MNRPEVIKSITAVPCPHCEGVVYVCQSFLQPTLTWVITDLEMKSYKTRLKELIKSIVFKSKKEEDETITWIDSEECVLGEDDIEPTAQLIAKEQKE
jgi:hypothetical protein